MKRWIESVMVFCFMLTMWTLAFAQADGALPAVGGMTLGWDVIFLTAGGIGLTALTKRILPDALEVKWIPVVATVWQVSGTFIWKAIVHQAAWDSALLILCQALLQALVSGGLLSYGWHAKAIVTGEKTDTLGDGRS